MGRRKKTGEVKIRIINSKVENVKEIRREESLEQQLTKETDEKFEEFVNGSSSSGSTLETGQTNTGERRENAQPENVPIERQENVTQTGERGATVNPEFSVYEIARTLAVRDTNPRTRMRYETAAHPNDAVMKAAVDIRPVNEMANVIDRKQRIDIIDPELERLRNNDNSRRYYESSINPEEAKIKRKMHWE